MAVFLSEKGALSFSLFGIFPTINARTAAENHHGCKECESRPPSPVNKFFSRSTPCVSTSEVSDTAKSEGRWINSGDLSLCYGWPTMLIGALMDPSTGVKIEGLNYFADTLLFGATILSLANASLTNNSIDKNS